MLLQTTQDLPNEFPYLLDMNNGGPIGIGEFFLVYPRFFLKLGTIIAWNQFSIDHKGERSSAATAYIEPAGNNLHVLLNTQVTRVLPVGSESRFRGVEFAVDVNSPRKHIVARKEVIVAGGIFGTPQILLNSGIGDHKELQALNIKTLVDNPSVGKNLTDQVTSLVMFNTTLQDTEWVVHIAHRCVQLDLDCCSFDRDTALAEWNATRTGPLSLPGHLNHIIYVRFSDDAPPSSQNDFTDPSPWNNSPHIEMVHSQISSQLPQTAIDFPPPPPGE